MEVGAGGYLLQIGVRNKRTGDQINLRDKELGLGRHAALLSSALTDGLTGETRLLAAVALAELGLCAEGMSKLQRRATRLLAEELTREILPFNAKLKRIVL